MLEERPITETQNAARMSICPTGHPPPPKKSQQEETDGNADRELQEKKAAIASEPRWS